MKSSKGKLSSYIFKCMVSLIAMVGIIVLVSFIASYINGGYNTDTFGFSKLAQMFDYLIIYIVFIFIENLIILRFSKEYIINNVVQLSDKANGTSVINLLMANIVPIGISIILFILIGGINFGIFNIPIIIVIIVLCVLAIIYFLKKELNKSIGSETLNKVLNLITIIMICVPAGTIFILPLYLPFISILMVKIRNSR